MLANYGIDFTAKLSALSGDVAIHKAMCRDTTGGYVQSTAAARAASPYSTRSEGVGTQAGAAGGSIPIMYDGIIPAGLGTGPETPCVVDAAGNLTRKATPAAGDDVIGRVLLNGDVRVQGMGSGATSSWPFYWVDVTLAPFNAVADADGNGGGTNCAAAITAAMQSLDVNIGPLVIIPPGQYRLAPYATAGSAVGVNRATKFKGMHSGQNYGGTILYVDAGCTGFDILPFGGQDSSFEDITIAASGRLATSTGASYVPGTKTITLASAGDWKNGQAIRIPGAGGLLPMTGTLFQATSGSATVAVSGPAGGAFGIQIGSYVVFGAGFLTRTRVTAVTYTGQNISSITMARVAGASDANPVTPTLACDVLAQIQSGGGTTTLIIDATGAAFGSGPSPWAGTIGALDLSIFHADSAIYAKCMITVRDCVLGSQSHGFVGAGICNRGSAGGDVPESNSNLARFENCWAFDNGYAVYLSDTDSNSCKVDQVRSIGSKIWSFVDASGLGCTFDTCHADGGYGFLTGPSPNTVSRLIGCYVEGGTVSFLGDGTNVFGGNVGTTSGGTIVQGVRANRMFFGDIIHQPTFFSHEVDFDPTAFWERWFSANAGAASSLEHRRSTSGDGATGWHLWQHTASSFRSFAIADGDVGGGETPGMPWFPNGYRIGTASNGTLNPSNSRRVFWGPSSPVTNGMQVGSRCYNDGSIAQVVDYWYCTVSGSPDTWVASNA